MAQFTVTGDIDPFLHVSLLRGEKIYCESNAMVMMESALELQGKMTGGLGSALMRRFANGESFFQQHIEATRGDGDCLLSPTLPGAIQVLDVGATSYRITDGAFVAAESGVSLNVRTQSLGTAVFGQTGGFFICEAAGLASWRCQALAPVLCWMSNPARTLLLIMPMWLHGIAVYTMKFL